MSEIETPLCQELHASSLDSNDIRAWRSLAYRLERGLTLLGRSALSQEAVREEALREIMEEVQRATSKFPTWTTDPLHAVLRRDGAGAKAADERYGVGGKR